MKSPQPIVCNACLNHDICYFMPDFGARTLCSHNFLYGPPNHASAITPKDIELISKSLHGVDCQNSGDLFALSFAKLRHFTLSLCEIKGFCWALFCAMRIHSVDCYQSEDKHLFLWLILLQQQSSYLK